MSKIKTPHVLLAVLFVVAATMLAYFASAQAADRQNPKIKIAFPVAALGNCATETACRAYCDKPENMTPCITFAKSHGLMSEEEATHADKFKDIMQGGGPGGCKNQQQCEAYCDDQKNMDECINFAEQHGMMMSGEVAEARKVQQALAKGAQRPGNCRSKQQCETYCAAPEHTDECFAFAEKAGMIPPEELENAKKMMALIKSGDAPQACRQGKEQCQEYCSDKSHADECANFMVKAGFMKPEDAEMYKKTGGKGPGGCKGDECKEYCNVPEHQNVCFKFAEESGLIPKEQLEEMKKNQERFTESLKQMPDSVSQCIESAVGADVWQKIKSGSMMPSPAMGETVKRCFDKFMQTEQEKRKPMEGGQQGEQGNFEGGKVEMQQKRMGPGGCSSPEDCQKFCSDPANKEICSNFGGSQGDNEDRRGDDRGEDNHQLPGQPGQGPGNPGPGPGLPPPGGNIPMMPGSPLPPANGMSPAPVVSFPPSTTIPPAGPSSLLNNKFFGAIINFLAGR